MYSMQLASCVALTLVLLVNSAPTSSPAKETQQHLEQLLLDLQVLLRGIDNYKNLKLPMMLTFKFYLPKQATELKHLQCLENELGALQRVLDLTQSKSFHLEDAGNFISNIRVTVVKLKGSENKFECQFDDEPATVVEFLRRWIAICQSIISTMTQ
ncbi:interleukin 2 [Rattus norvegicus]|uniref:Interleukin-2 n=2 Tax=Rattus norvegicus TaxID=10116 RepID=IL2_RAT|nr:interleukin-2 precursor [Rattus norvegicus]XP_032752654.1 interleukin-2 [Rattus rattus]P17108.1 RecName: Full=Interleukin-2; Short=IL-2; AltName: Full=T-cell growth factor; Short=TCGF; Flags: Precursor [Rattus norvegicus]AAA41427.1 interleukin 2 precursor [Rattus norvegicus]EDM01295.1 interleukin 2 [Rattus norvegicus]|eukprot:NP_446288.1 interleukin-2 precursor [Rattus norvegicus]